MEKKAGINNGTQASLMKEFMDEMWEKEMKRNILALILQRPSLYHDMQSNSYKTVFVLLYCSYQHTLYNNIIK